MFTTKDFFVDENLKPTKLNGPKKEKVDESKVKEITEEREEQNIDTDTNENETRQNVSFVEIIPIPGYSGTTNDK